MLEMTGITKSYGPITVLEDMRFEVRSGEVHALLGANGAGKSTLIKVIGGLIADASGTIALDGQRLTLASPADSLRAGIRIVHQDTDLVPELSVAENMYLGTERTFGRSFAGLLSAMPRKRLVRAAGELLKAYELEIDPSSKIMDLAPGAQQLAQIARALSSDSSLLIFDEPTARLGKADRERLFKIFSNLRSRGKKIVFVTHYLDEVLDICDRATIMRDGRLVATLDVNHTDTKEISRLMVGDEVSIPGRKPGGGNAKPVISVRNASRNLAYSGVSMEIAAGEIVGLVGHVGSGRHEISRDIARSAGVFQGGGRSPYGFVPEDRRSEGIFPDLSVAENIGIGLLVGRRLFSLIPRREIKEASRRLIEQLEIKTNGPSQVISTLSGGNQQKVVFGRALVTNPDFYVIECPTVGVDVKAGAELHGSIFRLAERGAAILLSTDDLDEAILLSDRILVMRKGRLSAEIGPDEFSRQRLVHAMGAA